MQECAEWTQIKVSQAKKIAKAQSEGRDCRLILPHPDDIQITADGVTFLGPVNVGELDAVEGRVKFRDQLLLHWAFEHRTATGEDGPLKSSSSALLLLYLQNNSLPKRWRWSQSEFLWQMDRAGSRMTTRQLLAAVKRGWKELGIHVKRGKKLWPLAQTITTLGTIAQASNRVAIFGAGKEVLDNASANFLHLMKIELPLGWDAPEPQRVLDEMEGGF